jgi:hypothetical protein
MTGQEKVLEKKRGRPSIGKGLQFNASFRPEIAEQIDRFAANHGLSRSDAVRVLVQSGLRLAEIAPAPKTIVNEAAYRQIIEEVEEIVSRFAKQRS